MKRTLVYITLLFCLFGLRVNATHIVGGEIYYKNLGGNEYRISLIIYRDCLLGQAPFDDPAKITIYKDNNQFYDIIRPSLKAVSYLPSDIYDSCFQVPSGVCVERGYYEALVTLPAIPENYVLSYQRCCRNSSIKNITTPGDWGSTITTTITPGSVASKNSSPVFINLPPLAICMGSDFVFDHSATDEEGDSLIYELCEVLHGGGKDVSNPTGANGPVPDTATAPPYTNVVWNTGYTALDPIDATSQFQIDPFTGRLSGVPISTGQYVFGICVREYRNGTLLGISRREYQINVKICISAIQADFDPPADCQGLSVFLPNNSVRSNSYLWDFGAPGSNDTSSQLNGVFTFPDSGTYKVKLVANPGWGCADTIEKNVTVYHKLEADIDSVVHRCITNPVFSFQAGGQFQNYTNITWDFGTAAVPSSATGPNPTGINFADTGVYTIRVNMEHKGCRSSKTTQAIVYPGLIHNFIIRNPSGCTPLEVYLEDKSKAWTPIKSIWQVDNKTYEASEKRLSLTEPGEYVVTHKVLTEGGCNDSSNAESRIIKVKEGPKSGFSISETEVNIFDPTVRVSNLAEGYNSCQLFFGDEKNSFSCDDEHTFSKPGTFKVSQIVTNANGCIDTSSVYVTVENEFVFFLPNSFTPNDDGNNELFTPVVVGAKTIEFRIYDRWGKIVFETAELNKGWDGTNKKDNSESPIGTYVYQVKLRDFLNEFHFYTGNVYLVR